MRRLQLEHILRAAAGVTNEDEFVIVGSQAVLLQFPNAPDEMLSSNEADIYPAKRPELADLIDGTMGRDSPFHSAHGYFADGVGPETSKLPKGWRGRAKTYRSDLTGGAMGIAPEIHDLLVSKLIAGREKDYIWAKAAIVHGLADPKNVASLLDQVDADGLLIERAKRKLASFVQKPGAP